MIDEDDSDDVWLRVRRGTPLDKLQMRGRDRDMVLLDAKRSFKNGCMVLSVWGYPRGVSAAQQPAQRIRLEGAILPSNTPNEVWKTALRSMVLLVVGRLGAEHYVLRSKI